MEVESDSEIGGEEPTPRPPEPADVASLCGELNRVGAKYVIVGGYAIIQAGFPRLTDDLDLLIETTPENEAIVLEVLGHLPDGAAKQVHAGEVEQYGVVRVADEILGSVLKPPNEEKKVVPQRHKGDRGGLMLNKRFQWWGPLRQRLLKKVAL